MFSLDRLFPFQSINLNTITFYGFFNFYLFTVKDKCIATNILIELKWIKLFHSKQFSVYKVKGKGLKWKDHSLELTVGTVPMLNTKKPKDQASSSSKPDQCYNTAKQTSLPQATVYSSRKLDHDSPTGQVVPQPKHGFCTVATKPRSQSAQDIFSTLVPPSTTWRLLVIGYRKIPWLQLSVASALVSPGWSSVWLPHIMKWCKGWNKCNV